MAISRFWSGPADALPAPSADEVEIRLLCAISAFRSYYLLVYGLYFEMQELDGDDGVWHWIVECMGGVVEYEFDHLQ